MTHALLFPPPGDRRARTRRTSPAPAARHVDSSSLVLRAARRLPTIRLWLICGVGVVVAATLLSAAVSVNERFAVVAAQQDLQHRLRPAQEAAAQLTRAYVDQETGQRGFIWTGEAAGYDLLAAKLQQMMQGFGLKYRIEVQGQPAEESQR